MEDGIFQSLLCIPWVIVFFKTRSIAKHCTRNQFINITKLNNYLTYLSLLAIIYLPILMNFTKNEPSSRVLTITFFILTIIIFYLLSKAFKILQTVKKTGEMKSFYEDVIKHNKKEASE